MGTWTVVKFVSDDLIEAVPSNWLEGNLCFWPRYETIKMTKAIRNCDPVLPTWDKYEVMSFRHATYGDYTEARKKCQKAELTSDLNSEEDTPRRRRPPLKLILQSSSSSDSDECNSVPTKLTIKKKSNKAHVTLPTCPSFSLKKDSKQSGSESLGYIHQADENVKNRGKPHNIEGDSEHESIGSVTILKEKTGDSEPRTNGSITALKEKTEAADDHHSGKCTNTCIQFQKASEEYYKQILRKITMIELMMTDIRSQIKSISLRAQPPEEIKNINVWESISLPLDTEEELQEFEDFLKKAENMQKSVDELAKVGGDTTDEFVRRSLKKLMTNKLQSQFSWLGRKHKKIFSVLQLPKLIENASWKNYETKTATEKQIEESIQKCLKRAKERADAEIKIMRK